MKNSRLNIHLPTYANEAINLLNNAGFEAWIVGGFVRDSIISNNYVSDIDIATNANWKQVKHLFDKHNWTVYELGTKFGTVGVKKNGHIIEITTYRRENKYSDSRHPDKIELAQTIKQDLARRDFTCNAIAYHPAKGVIDPYDGLKDIKAKIIRCVGNANERLKEDYLRILRALRFASQLNFNIETDTNEALLKLSNNITKISSERIREELTKLLCAKYARNVLDKYRNILFELIPEMKPLNNYDQKTKYHSYDAYTHTLIVIDKMPLSLDYNRFSKDADRQLIEIGKWAALLHDIGKPDCFSQDELGQGHFYGHPKRSSEISKGIFKKYKFSKKMRDSILLLIRWHDQPMEATKKSVRRMLNKFSAVDTLFSTYDMFRIYCDIRRADSYAHAKNYREYLTFTNEIEAAFEDVICENEAFSLKDLQIKGGDILDLGIEAGPQISKILNKCLQAVINEKIPNEKEALINFAKSI